MDTHVLIVEDEALIGLDLKKKLEQAGYSVPLIADNAAGANTEACYGLLVGARYNKIYPEYF